MAIYFSKMKHATVKCVKKSEKDDAKKAKGTIYLSKFQHFGFVELKIKIIFLSCRNRR